MTYEIFCHMKETLSESAPAYSTVAKWHAEFTWHRLLCGDLQWCGWPASSINEETIIKVNKVVIYDWQLSVDFITTSVGISTVSVYLILMENLLMKKVSAQWVPWMLSDVQKANQVNASTSLLCLFNKNPDNFISWFLTVDESWLYYFNCENKVQSMALKHASCPPPRKFHVDASAHKVMVTVFWDAVGIVLTDYLEHDSIITGIYCADLDRKDRAALKEKRWGKLHCGVLFHQNNTPAHASSQTLAAVQNAGFKLLHYTSHLPDLAPSNLFPKLKEFM